MNVAQLINLLRDFDDNADVMVASTPLAKNNTYTPMLEVKGAHEEHYDPEESGNQRNTVWLKVEEF